MRASIAVRSNCDASDLAIADCPGHLWRAEVTSHTADEALSHVVVLEGDHRPGSKSSHLCNNSFQPCLEKRVFRRDTVDSCCWNISLSQISLMEHKSVMMKTKKTTGVGLLLICEEISKGSLSGGVSDPFIGGALGNIAVIVDVQCPSRDDDHTGESIVSNGGDVRPMLVLLVNQWFATVITNNVCNSQIVPCFDGIAIVETGDSWWDNAVGTESCALGESRLVQPVLIPGDFSVDIVIRCVVLVLVGEGVRQMSKGISVGGCCEPVLQGVEVRACGGVWVFSWKWRSCWPVVGSGIQRLLIFQWGIAIF